MATTLHREATASPTQSPAISSPRGSTFLTIGLVVSALLTAALVGSVVFGGGTIDGSSEFAEEQRMMLLAPGPVSDGSHESAEAARMGGLAPRLVSDGSHESAESARMGGLAPTIDGSWERAEQERHQRLAGGD